jgi:hypothetical protein
MPKYLVTLEARVTYDSTAQIEIDADDLEDATAYAQSLISGNNHLDVKWERLDEPHHDASIVSVERVGKPARSRRPRTS